MKIYQIRNAFTLVELIVVIVILAILSTIAFISFKDYSSQSRDSVRLSDITNISKGLELYQVKVGTYPVPVNSITYTGGTSGGNILSQGALNGNIILLSKSNPTDPFTNTPYIYSVSGNSSYYQIYSELENISSFNSDNINSVYAANSKQVLIKGNYSFDPSLPSLIVIPSSVNSSSGIFDSNVCFINQSQSNLLSSSTPSNCIKKKNVGLKNIDSNLIGYWDMETCSPNCTTSGGILTDLSGNGNNGNIFGTNIISTGGIIGKGLSFSGDTSSYIEINKDTGSLLNSEEISVVANLNTIVTTSYRGWIIGDTYTCNGSNRCSNFQISNTANNFNPPLLMIVANNNSLTNLYGLNYAMDFDRKNTNVVFIRKNGMIAIYVNGIKGMERTYDKNLHFPNNKPYRLGIAMFSPGTVRFFGVLDDIKIYNRVLSDTEILQQAKIVGY